MAETTENTRKTYQNYHSSKTMPSHPPDPQDAKQAWDRGALPFDQIRQKVGTTELTVRSGNQATLRWFLGSKCNFLNKFFEISKIAALGPAITAVSANFAIF